MLACGPPGRGCPRAGPPSGPRARGWPPRRPRMSREQGRRSPRCRPRGRPRSGGSASGIDGWAAGRGSWMITCRRPASPPPRRRRRRIPLPVRITATERSPYALAAVDSSRSTEGRDRSPPFGLQLDHAVADDHVAVRGHDVDRCPARGRCRRPRSDHGQRGPALQDLLEMAAARRGRGAGRAPPPPGSVLSRPPTRTSTAPRCRRRTSRRPPGTPRPAGASRTRRRGRGLGRSRPGSSAPAARGSRPAERSGRPPPCGARCAASTRTGRRRDPGPRRARPARFTMARPAVPSSRAPVRITPMTRRPWKRAAERNRGSMAGRCRFSLSRDHRADVVALDHHVAIGRRDVDACAARRARPVFVGMPGGQRAGPARGSRAGCCGHPGAMCRTANTVASKSGGSPRTRSRSASTPPADAPTTTMSRRRLTNLPSNPILRRGGC